MTSVTVTIRPGTRTQIRGLPWTGKPADNYELLEDCIQASRRGQVGYEAGIFSVARNHTQALVSGLAQHSRVDPLDRPCESAPPRPHWTVTTAPPVTEV